MGFTPVNEPEVDNEILIVELPELLTLWVTDGETLALPVSLALALLEAIPVPVDSDVHDRIRPGVSPAAF